MPSMEDAGEIKSPVLIFFSSVKIVKIIVRALTEPGDYKFYFFFFISICFSTGICLSYLTTSEKKCHCENGRVGGYCEKLAELGTMVIQDGIDLVNIYSLHFIKNIVLKVSTVIFIRIMIPKKSKPQSLGTPVALLVIMILSIILIFIGSLLFCKNVKEDHKIGRIERL